ncbi:GNAT family protein [Massilia sp. YIM B02769]|uniref:GNAT family N-acetyltransferase n=1 Tax=unclassified Massilia TaxID=2609279 RepID=UPI0025B6B63D|nr:MULTISPECIES: GNAT family protein [unclassified Massilia]MDN4057862.1 GNAT family protein [Massilia sp. YIM B02769]
MIRVEPITLDFNGVRLEPLHLDHVDGLRAAAADGQLWNIRVTSVPEPHRTQAYVHAALETPNRLAFAVVDAESNRVLGSTSYHDIVPELERVEIGYTWYAQSVQRSHVNTSCKLLLLSHAFDTLGCAVVGLRTDNFNFASQAAIERLGARKDGVIRHHGLRRDGTVRDTVMYSIVRGEWPEIKAQLHYRLERHGHAPC